MSLKDYSLHLSHAVKTTLGKVKDMVEFFKIEYPNPKYNDIFIRYSFRIHNELEKLRKVVKFMLSYAASTIDDIEDFEVGKLVQEIFNTEYQHVFVYVAIWESLTTALYNI